MRSVTRARLAASLAVALLLVSSAAAAALPKVSSSQFAASTSCGCHAALVEDWRPSMHHQALTDPLYQLKLAEADKATGGALGPFCNACHGPVAVMSGEIAGTDQSRLSAVSAEGVACGFCHQVTGTEQPLGNTSAKVEADGVRRAQLKDPDAPHAAAYSAFHETAEFCGTCHNVDHPGNGMHLEATYSEWKAGPYAAEGIVCQDCHMTPGPGVTKPSPGKAAGMGPEREHIYRMTFAGGNVALGDAVRAEERLKAAAAVALAVPEIAGPGETSVTVTVTNVGAGHYLPTGLTEVRQMWLEVVVTDAGGAELMRERRDFGSVLEDAQGNAPVELWEAVAFASDDRIPPRGSATSEYAFTMGESPATVEATLYYRSCSEEMAKKAGVEVPTTVMASASKRVFTSAEQKAETVAEEALSRGGMSPLAWAVVFAACIGVVAAIAVLISRKRS